VGEGGILLSMAEPQEVARKPGVRHGGLSPGGYRRERCYRFLFQSAPWKIGSGYRNRRRGGNGVLKRGESPFCPARERFVKEGKWVTKIAQN